MSHVRSNLRPSMNEKGCGNDTVKLAIIKFYAVNGTSKPYQSSEDSLIGTRHDRKLAVHYELLPSARALRRSKPYFDYRALRVLYTTATILLVPVAGLPYWYTSSRRSRIPRAYTDLKELLREAGRLEDRGFAVVIAGDVNVAPMRAMATRTCGHGRCSTS
ncbi:hypothetical protein FHL15_003218 [Xylaria flabelliformis]|uniref:Endonuclease/exonuclease/phosphatase domain-containing protein n=1 Tax=Xylaria flabelliformis TaxID=2512241 RepID=A0A553I7A4_9PEZI|nr:hypothetical protein FHL15_003218 [Xylaria flabelliformis]